MTYVPFSKTLELMQLADMAALQPKGVCLKDIQSTFKVNHRSAQRMARALEKVFPTVDVNIDRMIAASGGHSRDKNACCACKAFRTMSYQL